MTIDKGSSSNKGDASRGAGASTAEEAAVPATPKGFKRLRLVRSIILSGEHEDEGSIHDVALPLAQRLIGEGSAVHHLEDGESPEPGPTSVNRMEEPENRETKSIPVHRPAPKIKQSAPDKK